MRKLYSVAKLVRLQNCLLAGVGVWMGWYLSSYSLKHINVIIASIAAALVCGAGNALNDFLDIDADRLNHPNRPLPREELPNYMAVLIMLVFNVVAILLALMTNWQVLAIVVGAILLLVLYNFKLKKVPLVGNLAVSLLGGATFIVGGLTDNGNLGQLPGPVVPAIFAFLFHFGRELIKDVADLEGDLKSDYRTLASVLTRRKVLTIAASTFILLLILTTIPVYQGWYQPAFNYIVYFAVDLPIFLIILFLFFGKGRNRFSASSNILKILMLLGLIAFYFGKKL